MHGPCTPGKRSARVVGLVAELELPEPRPRHEAGGVDEAEAQESLPAEFEGEALTIAFNATYLLDGLGSLDSDEATLAFTGPTKPAVLTGKGGADGGTDHRYLLMPVRLSS